MTGSHARTPLVPFWVLILGIVVAGASALWATSAGRPDGRLATLQGAPNTAAPRPTPSATPSTREEPKGALVIHGTGDVSLDPGYISTFATNGFDYAWSGLRGLFRRDDLTIVNVECPVTDRGSQLAKEFSFHGSTAALPAMRRAGVDVGSLANNHAYDRGPEGVVDSRRNLQRAGIAAVGAGKDQAEALAPAMFELKGWTVAVLGFDEVLDPLDAVAGPAKPGTAAGHEFPLMVRAVRAAARHADIVLVMIHWGVELDTQPRDYQIAEGHRLIDVGADMIFGSHSHRLQPMSIYRGRPIFWSLGNFVWPNFSTEGSTTAVARVRVTPRGRFIGKLVPAYITAPGHPVIG